MTSDYTDRFLSKLAGLRSADPICAEMIRRECEFFANECEPVSDIYDVHEITVEHIGGQPIATLLVIVDRNRVLFFDLIEADQLDEGSE